MVKYSGDMSRQIRQRSVTDIYHVIQRGINRMLIFLEDDDRLMFINLLKLQTCESFQVYCYCLMDNHIHLIVKSDRLSIHIHRISTIYAIWFNHKYERQGYLFQDRFKSEVIENQDYLLRCFRYVLQNPLKAGVCCKISEFRWSSYHVYFNETDSFISTEFLSLFFDCKNDFQNYVTEDDSGTFMDLDSRLKDHEVRKLLEEMLKGKSFETLSKEEQRVVLKKLKQNPKIRQRQLARITGIDLNQIHRL